MSCLDTGVICMPYGTPKDQTGRCVLDFLNDVCLLLIGRRAKSYNSPALVLQRREPESDLEPTNFRILYFQAGFMTPMFLKVSEGVRKNCQF